MPHECRYVASPNLHSNTVQSQLLDALLGLFLTHLENDLGPDYLPRFGWPNLTKIQRVNVETKGGMSFLHFDILAKDQTRHADSVILRATFAVKTE